MKYATSVNIAEDLDREDLLRIGQRCVDDYEADEDTLDDWRKTNKEAVEAAKQIREEKSTPWENAANIKYPLLTTAALHFNARAMPAILNGAKIVKGQVVGDDPDGAKKDRSERIGEHMSYQLLNEVPGWEEDTDKLLMVLPIVGNVFRKTYFDPLLAKNVSKIVWAEDFTFNYKQGFKTAPQHTEKFCLYPQRIIERQRYGLWLDVDIGLDEKIEEEELEEFIEQHCLIDLDDDGYKEPYIVTVHIETREVLRIVARFDVEEMMVRYQGEMGKIKEFQKQEQQAQQQHQQIMVEYQRFAAQQQTQGIMPPPPPMLPEIPVFDATKAEVMCIEPVEYYTKYGFIPAFDGGGYDVGFGSLLDSITHTIDTNLNQMIDAGTLANQGGGLISRGLQIRKGQVKVKMNEWTTVDNPTGGSIRDAFVAFDHRGPNPVAMNLLTFLLDAGRDITSVKDATTGEAQGANESPTTYLTRVSEGLKVFSAIYNRVHRSLKEELKKFYRLNRLYLPEESYYVVLDNPKAVKRADYMDDIDVVPVSDPTIATTTQKTAKAQAIYQSGRGNPRYNQYEVERRFLDALDVDDIDGLLLRDEEMPPPPQDPKMIEMQGKLEKMAAETEKIKAETVKTYNDIQATVVELNQKFDELDIKRLGNVIDLLSKIVTEPENLKTYREATSDGGINGGGVPRLEGLGDNQEGGLPIGPGTQ